MRSVEVLNRRCVLCASREVSWLNPPAEPVIMWWLRCRACFHVWGEEANENGTPVVMTATDYPWINTPARSR